MVRVVDFKIDEFVSVRLAAMSWAEAEKFQEETAQLLANKEATKSEDWMGLTQRTVIESIKKATTIRPIDGQPTNGDFTLEVLKRDFDLPAINAMYFKVLEISGLKTEVKS
jgi:hypothetical protein